MQAQTCASVSREDEKISKVINHVLTQVFGEEATDLIYRHLERAHSIKRDEVASKIDVFAKGLEEFLSSGAYAVERKILEDIYSSYGLLRRLEIQKNQMGSDFVDQIKCLVRKA